MFVIRVAEKRGDELFFPRRRLVQPSEHVAYVSFWVGGVRLDRPRHASRPASGERPDEPPEQSVVPRAAHLLDAVPEQRRSSAQRFHRLREQIRHVF
jgi:hypothetical protein